MELGHSRLLLLRSVSLSTEIPLSCQDFTDVFSKQKAGTILEHLYFDCATLLLPGHDYTRGKVYPLSLPETMATYIVKNLERGLIQKSSLHSEAGSFTGALSRSLYTSDSIPEDLVHVIQTVYLHLPISLQRSHQEVDFLCPLASTVRCHSGLICHYYLAISSSHSDSHLLVFSGPCLLQPMSFFLLNVLLPLSGLPSSPQLIFFKEIKHLRSIMSYYLPFKRIVCIQSQSFQRFPWTFLPLMILKVIVRKRDSIKFFDSSSGPMLTPIKTTKQNCYPGQSLPIT